MKKILKVILWLIGLALVLVIAVAVALVTVDPNEHRDWIADRLEQATGREVQLGGNLALTWYPWLGLEAADITMGNAPGFGPDPFLHADRVKLRAKLIPLLRQKYEIDTIQVDGAVINLARDASGRTSWADLAGEPARESEPVVLGAFVLGGVDIRDATLSWQDQGDDTRYDFTGINIRTNELVYGEPIDLTMRMDGAANRPALSGNGELTGTITYDMDRERIRIEPLALAATLRGARVPNGSAALSLSTAIELNLDEDTATLSALELDALGTRITGEVRASGVRTTGPGVTANISLQGSDLALWFRVLEIEPLATQLASLRDRHFNLELAADADLGRGDIDLTRLAADLIGAEVRGELTARNIRSPARSFRGELNATGPDLPALMQVLGQIQGGGEAALARYGAQLAAIPARQKAFSLVARFDADMKRGDIEAPELRFTSLGIDVIGNLRSQDMQDRGGSINGLLQVTGGDLSRVLAALGQPALARNLRAVRFETTVSGNRAGIDLKPLTLVASLAGDHIPGSRADIQLQADTNINLEGQRLVLENFSLRGLDLNVSGRLEAEGILEQPRVRGEIRADPFDSRRLLGDTFPDLLPVTADPWALSKVGLRTSFDGSTRHVELKGLELLLDESTLTGDLAVREFSPPVIRFGLTVDAINLDRYLPPKQEGGETAPATPETGAAAAAQLPVETLRALDAEGELSVGSLIVSGARLTDVRLRLHGRDGIITLDPVTAGLYQGNYRGDVRIDATGSLPHLTMNTTLAGVQADPLLTDVLGTSRIRGVGDFSAALTAAGADTDSMKQALNGQMSFRFRDGAIKGFNLGKYLRMGNQLQQTFTLKVSEQEETDFTEITGNPVVENGVVRLDDLDGKSPALRLKGEGVLADLASDSLDYQVSAYLVATAKGQGGKELQEGKLEGVPLECRIHGPTKQPKRDCNALKLLLALPLKGKDAIQDVGKQALEGLIGLPGRVIPGGAQQQQDGQGTAPAGDGQASQPAEQPADQQAEQDADPVKQIEDKLRNILPFGRRQ